MKHNVSALSGSIKIIRRLISEIYKNQEIIFSKVARLKGHNLCLPAHNELYSNV